MSQITKIQWTDHTFNPWIGCTKISPGCLNCYAAESTTNRVARKAGRDHWGKGHPRHRTSAATWRHPLQWNADRAASCPVEFEFPRVFPSLCDPFDNEIPIDWLSEFLELIFKTPYLRWQLLTKRPEYVRDRIANAMEYADRHWLTSGGPRSFLGDRLGGWLEAFAPHRGMGQIPPNIWLGVSVENQQYADRRIPELLTIPAAKRFLSCEPLLGPLDLREHFKCNDYRTAIHWCIIGGESHQPHGNTRPCVIDWIPPIIAQCRSAGVAPFVKQLGSIPLETGDPHTTLQQLDGCPLAHGDPDLVVGNVVRAKFISLQDKKGGDITEWPQRLQVREFPSA